jgi:hypothetical protein
MFFLNLFFPDGRFMSPLILGAGRGAPSSACSMVLFAVCA